MFSIPKQALVVLILITIISPFFGPLFGLKPPKLSPHHPSDPPPGTFINPDDALVNEEVWKKPSLEKITFEGVEIVPRETQVFLSFSLRSNFKNVFNDLTLIIDVSKCIAEGGEKGQHSFLWSGLNTTSLTPFLMSFSVPHGTTIRCISAAIIDQHDQVLGRIDQTIQASSYLYRLYSETESFGEEARLLFIGNQGVGKSSIINSMIHLLSGRSTQTEYASVESIRSGDGTTFSVTEYDSEWFKNRGLATEAKGYIDSRFVFIDSVGKTSDPSIFNERFWTRLFYGRYPQDWKILEDDAYDPSRWINKTAHMIILCVHVSSLSDTEGFIQEIGRQVDNAHKKTGGKVVLAITMINTLSGSYNITAEEMEEHLVLARKISSNSIVLMSYDKSGDSNWQIDFHNLKMLTFIARIVQNAKGETGSDVVPLISPKIPSFFHDVIINPGFYLQHLTLLTTLWRLLIG